MGTVQIQDQISRRYSRDHGVTLHETVTLKAPDMLFSYAFQQAQIAHGEMLKRIKAFVENS